MKTQTPSPIYLVPGAEETRRIDRLRRLAWLLDRSFSVGGYRFGIDPLLGLIPGVGDFVGSSISLYIVYEAARLGVPGATLFRMLGNVAMEALVGLVPIAGDAFDFFWQANQRNLRLIEQHYEVGRAPPRSLRKVALSFGIAAFVLLALIATGLVLIIRWALDQF